MKIVYHLGVHKTGTTLLQQNMVRNSQALREQGVYCVNGEWPDGIKKLRRRMRRLQNPDLATPQHELAETLNKRMLRRAEAAGAKTLLLSEENFIGNPIHFEQQWHKEPARFYPAAATCLKALTFGFAPADITVILYSRAQEGLLKGHYSEALRALEADEDFGGFLDRTDIGSFRFDDLLARMQAVLPGAQFEVKPFEAIKGGAERFVADFFARIGVDASGLDVIAEKVNPGITGWQADRLVELARRQKAGEVIPRLARKLRNIFEDDTTPKDPIAVPKRHEAAIRNVMSGDLSERLLSQLG